MKLSDDLYNLLTFWLQQKTDTTLKYEDQLSNRVFDAIMLYLINGTVPILTPSVYELERAYKMISIIPDSLMEKYLEVIAIWKPLVYTDPEEKYYIKQDAITLRYDVV